MIAEVFASRCIPIRQPLPSPWPTAGEDELFNTRAAVKNFEFQRAAQYVAKAV